MSEPIDIAVALAKLRPCERDCGGWVCKYHGLDSDIQRTIDALAQEHAAHERLAASAETWRADIEEALSKPGDLLTLAREMALALEVREESIADWKSQSEKTQRRVEEMERLLAEAQSIIAEEGNPDSVFQEWLADYAALAAAPNAPSDAPDAASPR